MEKFDTAFQEQYKTVHRLETNKLRNVPKFFTQFYTDALPWTALSSVHLNEEETNSSRYHMIEEIAKMVSKDREDKTYRRQTSILLLMLQKIIFL